jgi:hypothetical protein
VAALAPATVEDTPAAAITGRRHTARQARAPALRSAAGSAGSADDEHVLPSVLEAAKTKRIWVPRLAMQSHDVILAVWGHVGTTIKRNDGYRIE